MSEPELIGVDSCEDVFDVPEGVITDGRTHCLVVVQGILVGGASVDEVEGATIFANCWKVSDLAVAHWAYLADDQRELHWVPPDLWTAIRYALVRAHDAAAQALEVRHLVGRGKDHSMRLVIRTLVEAGQDQALRVANAQNQERDGQSKADPDPPRG